MAIPDEFGEGCRERREARTPETFGGVAQAGGFPDGPSDPVLRAAPFIECPAAVFIEEMETGSIDCEAWDEAGEEHIDYYWEPAGGAPQGYLDAPRLIGEDRLVPSIVAPSSPSYATLESFLSEEATLRYRYRLTALSRVTGLSSQEEVEVFVLLRRPSVYCPLEYEVPAGSEVVLSCEGADPLSFRMDYEEGSSVFWEWEGLWGSSASLLSGADTPSPSFRAPLGGSGETYDYVASMTTTSSGVPRTARRRVNVRVVEAEEMRPVTEEADLAATGSDVSLSANNSAPTITCVDYDVYPTAPDFTIHCSVTNEPAGAAYGWTSRGAPEDISNLGARNALRPTFSLRSYADGDNSIVFEYAVTLSAPGIADVTENVTVTIMGMPDIMDCKQNDYPVYAGDPDFQFDCSYNASLSGRDPFWITESLPGKYRLNVPRHFESAHFKPTFDVPENLSRDQTLDYYRYYVCLTIQNHEPDPKYVGLAPYDITESEYITVKVSATPEIDVECRGNPYSAAEGSGDFDLACEASGTIQGYTISYVWTPLGSTADTGLLSAANVPSPTFATPDNVDADETYEYRLKVSAQGIGSDSTDVTVTVFDLDVVRNLDVACAAPDPVYEGSADIELSCGASGNIPGYPISYAWTPRGSTADTGLLSATNVLSPTFDVPASVDKDETYEYLLTASADNAEDATAEVTVTVLNKGALTFTCAAPAPVYEGSPDVALSCEASGAPEGSSYEYAWEARGAAADADLLSATNVASPTFMTPEEVLQTTRYEYGVTASADNAEAATANVTVTVLDRPEPDAPPAFSADPTGLGVTVSVSSLRFGAQSADTQPSLDPLTGRLSTRASGPYHAGRMTLAPDGDLALDENGEIALSIELVTPVTLRREGEGDAPPLILEPSWSYAESCEQRFSQSIRGLHAQATLSESDCRLLFFGGALDLAGVAPGRYAGSIDVALRTGAGEETRSVEATVTVVAARLSASLLSLSEGASPAATFLVETDGVPFAGEAVAYDGQGRELGRSGTLVYTRSRMRMPLERLPEGETVFLRFTPRGSVRAPEPAVVPWRAPQRERRDIGAALDDGKTPSAAALAERP